MPTSSGLAAPVRRPVLLKHRYSAFDHTPLDLLLERLHIDRLVLIGAATEGCIVQTAIDAREHGLEDDDHRRRLRLHRSRARSDRARIRRPGRRRAYRTRSVTEWRYLADHGSVLLGSAGPSTATRGLSGLSLRITNDDPATLDSDDRRPRELVVRVRPDPEWVEVASSADAERDDFQPRATSSPSSGTADVAAGLHLLLRFHGPAGLHERVDDGRIELRTAVRDEFGEGGFNGQRAPVRPVGRHRVVRVAAADDARDQWNLLAGQTIRIATAVPALVAGADDGADVTEQSSDTLQEASPSVVCVSSAFARPGREGRAC